MANQPHGPNTPTKSIIFWSSFRKNNSNADYFPLNVARKRLTVCPGKASLSNFRFCLFCGVSYSVLYKRGNWTELTFAKTFGTVTGDEENKLKQHRRRRQRQRGRQKRNEFRLAKQQLCTCITLFCTFLCRRCTTTTWKCLISRFVEDVKTKQQLSFSLPELW